MANTQTFNYESEAAEMERRRRVLEAMQGSSLEPLQAPQAVGGMAAPTHWTQGLAKMVQAYGARKGQEQLKTDREALATRYGDDLRTGMDAYQQTAEGSSTPNFVMQPGADGMPENAVMKGNPRKAVLDAIASNHPVLREFGMSQLKKQGEGALTPKDLAAYANPTDVVRNPMDPSKWQGKRDIGETGGTVYDKNTLGVVQLGGPQPKRIVHQGDVYEESPSTGGWKKLDNAPKITNTVNMPKGESAFDKTLGEAEAKRFSQALEVRGAQIDGMQAIAAGQDLLKQGIHTGIFSNVARNLEKINAPLFNADPAKAARTEQFIAYIGDIVIPRLKDFGGSDTVEELKYLQKVQGGDVTMEAASLQRVLASAEAKMQRKLSETDAAAEAYKSRGRSLPTLDMGVQVGVPKPQPSSVRKYNPATGRIE